jgi:hypothetical protein
MVAGTEDKTRRGNRLYPGGIELRGKLGKPVDTRAEIIALLEGRSEESLKKIRQF